MCFYLLRGGTFEIASSQACRAKGINLDFSYKIERKGVFGSFSKQSVNPRG